ncbi:alanine--tRNA ligase [bacterium]|nr:alanine--tRNA ligase [bacterium]
MLGREIRKAFLDYFAGKGHRVMRSSPLVPQGDPTLLFVNAGMVQFKNVFLGQEDIGTKRAATSQKCLRVSGKHNDFDQVGRTPRHHTFFEMLGNFSFGDYFKRDAIAYGWEFVTQTLGIPADRLTATVFEEDDEAEKLWLEISGLPEERVVRMGAEDNFWAMGDTGPCGPCSEIHVDMRPGAPGGIKDDPDRFLEIWNLVFMQFDRAADGTMKPLPAPSVDTGAGLERLAAVVQGVPTNFDTDLFAPIRERIAARAGKTYGEDADATVSMRVVCDHARSITFLIGDSVLPSNVGRGYVLRRVMRRAARHGVLLGIREPFLVDMVDGVVEAMRDQYPELVEQASYIKKVVRVEEERFLRTLDNGLRLLNQETANLGGARVLAGDFAFKLYDTFGFPLDLTEDIGRSEGFTVDTKGFEAALANQRVKSSKGDKFDKEAGLGAALGELAGQGVVSHFAGYDSTELDAELVGIVIGGELVAQAGAGDTVELVFDATPFYGEKGGQIGDTGSLFGDGVRAEISDARWAGESLIVHHAKVTEGSVRVGDTLTLRVDSARRDLIRKNHTATHLLHHGLRAVLGKDAKQAGSLVAPDRLRFDFTHFAAMTDDEIREVERIANAMAMADYAVETRVLSYDDAVKTGAIALFGEKYGAEVRVVAAGDSVELCGGTHVARTGHIGPIFITGESAIAAGVRRLEAVTGPGAVERARRTFDAERKLTSLFKAPPEQVAERAEQVMDELHRVEKEAERLREKLTRLANKDLVDRAIDVDGTKLLAAVAQAPTANDLRVEAARLRDRLGSSIVALGAAVDGKAMLCVVVSPDLAKRFPAGKIVAPLAKMVGGGGGGKPDMAQAGGPDATKLDEAIASAEGVVRELGANIEE